MTAADEELDIVRRILRVASDGRCSRNDAIMAIGAWQTWHYHPELRADLFDGSMNLDLLAKVVWQAGYVAPWLEAGPNPPGHVEERSGND